MSSAAQRQNYTFFHSLRVRWAEVDPQGIVFNGNYLTYLDVATTEYYRQLGMSYPADLLRGGGDLFAVKSTLEYRAPAHFDDWTSAPAWRGWAQQPGFRAGHLARRAVAHRRRAGLRLCGCERATEPAPAGLAAREDQRSSDSRQWNQDSRRVAGRAARGRRHRFFPRLRGPLETPDLALQALFLPLEIVQLVHQRLRHRTSGTPWLAAWPCRLACCSLSDCRLPRATLLSPSSSARRRSRARSTSSRLEYMRSSCASELAWAWAALRCRSSSAVGTGGTVRITRPWSLRTW